MVRGDKVKWSEDPQNSRWSRDKSKYGFRMLQQMGWEEGKGLGAKEDGDTTHVRISRKKDNSGVGVKRGRDDDWIERQDTFDQILASLNAVGGGSGEERPAASPVAGKATPPQGKTLVDSAVEAKKIVYKRFLRSKDLSAQSSEDLDCVLGRKRRRRGREQGSVEGEGEAASTCCSHGVTTVSNGQSVQEYFSLKMAAMSGKVEPGKTKDTRKMEGKKSKRNGKREDREKGRTEKIVKKTRKPKTGKVRDRGVEESKDRTSPQRGNIYCQK